MMRTNFHPTSTPPEDQQPPRKIRKGTRSCWECKHRKVRCHFVSDGDQSCRECLARGATCRSQDLPEPEHPRESDRASLSDRLGRVESLIERVLQVLDTIGGGVEGARNLPSVATDNDLNSSTAGTPANKSAPAMSLFDNGVLGFRRSDASTPNITLYSSDTHDGEKLRHELLGLLPSRSTLRRLEQVNSSWWLVRAQCFQEYEQSLLSNAAAACSDSSHPTTIAKVILWVAICLQQLPRGFDVGSLELLYSPTRFIAKCVKIVGHSIGLDETLISNIDGLECLVLQGILYNNDGKLRSAWLCYRRALNVAQVIGLHRLTSESTDESESVSRARHIWNHIIYADRYLSLMLGMYHGIPDVALDLKKSGNETPNLSSMDLLCRIAGSIIERNQRFSKITPSMVRTTQTIDAELMSMDTLSAVEDLTILSPGKSIERARAYTRLMTQLWHYQLIAWLHLPLLLESGTERRYDYSRQSCLEASRNMITCYTSIRRLTANSFCCKSLDFQAFTAAVTLLINTFGPTGQSHLNSNDWPAIETVMTSLETLAEGQPPDKVATRGLSVMRALKRVATRGNTTQSDIPDGLPPMDGQPGRVKIDIPYFGTISLDCNMSNDLPGRQQLDNSLPSPISANLVSNSVPSLNAGDTMEASTMHDRVMEVELGPADIWSFDPYSTTLPSFLPDLEDNWDLGL